MQHKKKRLFKPHDHDKEVENFDDNQKTLHHEDEGFRFIAYKAYKIWHRPTLPHFTAVPSALAGLTSLFGMGRGGHRRYRHLNIFN